MSPSAPGTAASTRSAAPERSLLSFAPGGEAA
jgi:hypothetical protein